MINRGLKLALLNHATAADWKRLFVADKNKQHALYSLYIESKAWKIKREARLVLDSWHCQGCPLSIDLQVHHKHYRNLGDENVSEDLISLCHQCHADTHQNLPLLFDQ